MLLGSWIQGLALARQADEPMMNHSIIIFESWKGKNVPTTPCWWMIMVTNLFLIGIFYVYMYQGKRKKRKHLQNYLCII
jgi:hypothetical protein